MPIFTHPYSNFTWNAWMRSGSRSDTSARARNRFRFRTLLASVLFVALLGGLIELINLARRPADPPVAMHEKNISSLKGKQ